MSYEDHEGHEHHGHHGHGYASQRAQQMARPEIPAAQGPPTPKDVYEKIDTDVKQQQHVAAQYRQQGGE